jgi:hypothetical protein
VPVTPWAPPLCTEPITRVMGQEAELGVMGTMGVGMNRSPAGRADRTCAE